MISESEEKALFLKELVQKLQKSTIDGSAITMCLLPNKNVNEYRSLLANEILHAANIKDKSNKLSVVEGLKSAREALKDYKKVPANGLIVIAANVMMQDNHVYQKIVQVIEPSQPITKEVYSCGKNFAFNHIHEEILVNDKVFGFIIVDGASSLYATLKGNHKRVLKQIKSDIMRNHNKGGQSSVRFSRLRDQSRYNYIKAACQQANKQFSNVQEKIEGFIVAGSANMKNQLVQNEILAPFISKNVIKLVDVAQGSQQGLKQAIIQSKDVLMDHNLLKEKKVLQQFFQTLNKSNEKITNGLHSVTQVLSIGIVQKVICSQQIFQPKVLQNIKQLCQANGCQLIIISNRSQEATIFCQSYGGIGAILRYEFDASYIKQTYMEDQTGIEQKEQFFF